MENVGVKPTEFLIQNSYFMKIRNENCVEESKAKKIRFKEKGNFKANKKCTWNTEDGIKEE